VAWEAPHYTGRRRSRAHGAAAVQHHLPARRLLHRRQAELLRRHRQGLRVGQFYPVRDQRKDYYGQRVLPENLGNIEYDISTIDPTSNYNYTPTTS
jgi:uncharacterized protein YdaL